VVILSIANITSLGTIPTDYYKGKIPAKPDPKKVLANRGRNSILTDPFAIDTEIPNPVPLPKYLANNISTKPVSTAEALQEIKETQSTQVLTGISLRNRTGDAGSSEINGYPDANRSSGLPLVKVGSHSGLHP
jgi:hypothetical protein